MKHVNPTIGAGSVNVSTLTLCGTRRRRERNRLGCPEWTVTPDCIIGSRASPGGAASQLTLCVSIQTARCPLAPNGERTIRYPGWRSVWRCKARCHPDRLRLAPLRDAPSAERLLLGRKAARPRCFTSSASCRMESSVTIRPLPAASEALALSTAARISARRRSRSSQRESASCTASSGRFRRPDSMACRTNAVWSGVKSTSMRF